MAIPKCPKCGSCVGVLGICDELLGPVVRRMCSRCLYEWVWDGDIIEEDELAKVNDYE